MEKTTVQEKRNEGFLGQKMLVLPHYLREEIQGDDLISPLYLTDIGYYPHAQYHFVERDKGADQHILIHCTEGHGWIAMEGEQYDLYPNSYFIIPPGLPHSYGAVPEDPWNIYWLHFTGKQSKNFYRRFLHRNNAQNKPGVVSLPYHERRTELFDHLIQTLENGYSIPNIEYVNLALWELLTSFIYDSFFSKSENNNLEKDLADKAIDFMQQHLDQSITVEDVANHLNYSSSYLYSIFKEKTGYSPIDYFNHLKIQKACQYLSFTRYSIKEICYELGYNDPCYFSRIFKKFTDMSPSDYRSEYGG